ncbi:hypothetical protein FA15DRAFT_670473 [Coprinopsis marcescibilis]|uniref:RING-type domain-containing protein n=1 Tax=Coprinopsis marcescibilis TaxID=230819 RepID=A0A5C3KUD5_COPMA|nr:hypothetical protein FA15DRAFT_670473 [Coprinopsis marcescibilis]
MEATSVVVAEVPTPSLHLSMPYNLTLNLNFTSFLSFLPSKLLSKSKIFTNFWRKWDEVVEMGMASERIAVDDLLAEWPTADTILEVATQATSLPADTSTPQPTYAGPWAFFTSGYMFGILVMAVILHRIQNIIIPSRIPHRRLRPGVTIGWQRRFSFIGRISSVVFPLDLTKTSTRLAIHLPTLYFLARMLLIWIVLILQTSGLYPEGTSFRWVNELSGWVQSKQMNEICWSTFCAVCASFSVEGFVKALDGVEAGFPIGGNMNPNTSPFNIVGYAFLLHLYSSPFTHSFRKDESSLSRPDKHAIITVAIPLLQLTIFHVLSISKRWSTHRLFPTALSSLLSLLHFHSALLAYYNRPVDPTAQSPKALAHTRLLTTYPILNYIPNIFETMLLLTILLTVVLNVVVQMVVRGRVERIFSGLGVSPVLHSEDDPHNPPLGGSTIRAFFENMPYEEDFGVLLLRIGTASLEATGLRGWSNEVAPIPAPMRRRRRDKNRRLSTATLTNQPEFGSVRVGRVAAAGVQAGFRLASNGVSTIRRRKQRLEATRGLENEVRSLDVGVGRVPGEGTGERSAWWKWMKEILRYAESVWAAAKGLVRLSWSWLLFVSRGRRSREIWDRKRTPGRRSRRAEDGSIGGGGESSDEDETTEDSAVEKDKAIYARFVRGESISDDEDDDAEFRFEEQHDDDQGMHDDSTTPDGATESEDPEQEAFALFSDLMRTGDGGRSVNGDLILAHLADGSSPLTRRRWNSLSISKFDMTRYSEDEYDEDDDDEHGDVAQPSAEDSGRSMCVICTSSARDIICWPCRCLAMCDSCREALASRSAPTKHSCPCCRQLIEGYSKIYIP